MDYKSFECNANRMPRYCRCNHLVSLDSGISYRYGRLLCMGFFGNTTAGEAKVC